MYKGKQKRPARGEIFIIIIFNFLPADNVFYDLKQMQRDTHQVNKESNLSADLIKIASEKGFRISDNPASGNCMFYALSEQLQSVQGREILQRELRETLVRFLRENPILVSQW